MTGYIVPLIIARMKPFPSLFVRLRPFVSLSSLLIVSLFMGACGGGSTSSGADGGIIATGRALVSGNVASSTLPGDLNSITVTIQSRSTTTNSAGLFQLDDVPAGQQKIVFSKGGQASSLPLNLQSQSKTTLKNVHIDDKFVSTEKVEVDDHSNAVEAEDPQETIKPKEQNELTEQSEESDMSSDDEQDSQPDIKEPASSEDKPDQNKADSNSEEVNADEEGDDDKDEK